MDLEIRDIPGTVSIPKKVVDRARQTLEKHKATDLIAMVLGE